MTDEPHTLRVIDCGVIDMEGHENSPRVLLDGDWPSIRAAAELLGEYVTLSRGDKRASSQESETIARLTAEREELQYRVEELEADAERVSHEFEGECWKALRTLLDETNFEWEPNDDVTAQDAYEHLSETLRDFQRSGKSNEDVYAQNWIESVEKVVRLKNDLRTADERLDEAKEKNFDLARRVEYLENQLRGARSMKQTVTMSEDEIDEVVSLAQDLLSPDGEQSWERRDQCVDAAIKMLKMARELRKYEARKAT